MKITEALQKFNQWRNLKVKHLKGYDLDLRYFAMHMRNCDIEDVTLEHIIDWLQMFCDMDFDKNTVIKKAMALKIFFEFYHMQKYDVVNPLLIPIPKKEFKFPRVADEESYQKLLSVIPKKSGYYWHARNRAIITMLWDSGARLNEILSLDIPNVDTVRMKAHIKTAKSQGAVPFRQLFWRKTTNEEVIKWLEVRTYALKTWRVMPKEPDALFISMHGGQKSNWSSGTRTHVSAITEMIRKYSNKAGLEKPLNPHSMRHHMGRELARKGANNSVISSVLGHSSLPSSYPYTMLEGTHLEKEYRKLVGG